MLCVYVMCGYICECMCVYVCIKFPDSAIKGRNERTRNSRIDASTQTRSIKHFQLRWFRPSNILSVHGKKKCLYAFRLFEFMVVPFFFTLDRSKLKRERLMVYKMWLNWFGKSWLVACLCSSFIHRTHSLIKAFLFLFVSTIVIIIAFQLDVL